MSRSEKIKQIIANRASKQGEVEQRKQWLEKVRSSVNQLRDLLPAMQENSSDSAYLNGVGPAAEVVTSHILELDSLLGRLAARCSRRTLKIGIVGEPKQGKSSFLQSLTGLDEATVPTGDVWVTGANSYLCNDENAAETYAEVYPYTRESFLGAVLRPFYKELGMRPITRVEDLLSTEFPDGEGLTVTQAMMLKRLVSLKEHYGDYKELLDRTPFRIAKSQIREYVAQTDQTGEKEYHKWYAVEHAEIHCRFPQQEVGNIMVCDTPGLGDFTAGAREKLISTLYRDMDVIFLLKMLVPTNQNVSEGDAKFIDAIDNPGYAYHVGDWTYVIVNKKTGDTLRPDFRAKLASELRCPNLYELNAKDEGEVSSRFDSILDSVVAQMPNLDELLFKQYDEQIRALKKSIAELVEQASSRSRKGAPVNKRHAVRDYTRKMLDQMTERLLELRDEYSSPEMLHTPQFVQAMKRTLEGMSTPPEMNYSPRHAARPDIWMGNTAASLRFAMTSRFVALDEELEKMIQEMRDRISSLLLDERGGNLGFLMEKSTGSVWENLKSAIMDSSVREPQYWVVAIEMLENMRIPVRSFFLPHIVGILDMFDSTDGSSMDDPILRNLVFTSGDTLEICKKKLTRMWEYACNQIEQGIMDDDSDNQTLRAVMNVPGQALVAAIKEFIFAWLQGGGSIDCEQRWEDFYGDYAALIWPSEFGDDTSSPFALAKQWKDCVTALKASIN